MSNDVTVSFVMATRNRRGVVESTLRHLLTDRAPDCSHEMIVVDNASTDGTAHTVRDQFPGVRLIARSDNMGSCAKAFGVDAAAGRFVVFLDDDSYPRPGTIERMLVHFEQHPRLGAAGFRVHLPDGREECAALPDVFVGCGVGFRADALRAVGGLDRGLFIQAEEYDLAFRLVQAGYDVRMFTDLHVDHLKTTQARRSDRTVYHDTRNNLIVAARYLPRPYFRPVLADCLQRYRWLAQVDGATRPYLAGAAAGLLRCRAERRRFRNQRLSPAAFESLFRFRHIADRFAELAASGVRRVVLAGLGKNVLAFVHGARESGLSILAIGDDRLAMPNRAYRGTPLLPLGVALQQPADAVVVANCAPIHAQTLANQLAESSPWDVHCWFTPCQSWHGATAVPTDPAGPPVPSLGQIAIPRDPRSNSAPFGADKPDTSQPARDSLVAS